MHARINQINLHFHAEGDQTKPTLVFVNSLGTDFRIWEKVTNRLKEHFHIIRYDKRGHGLSDCSPENNTIRDHAGDLSGLLTFLNVKRATICGISVGGLIAQEFYRMKPESVEALVLSNTGYRIGDDDTWNARIKLIEKAGFAEVVDSIIARWFSEQYRKDNSSEVSIYRNMLQNTSKQSYIATCKMIRDTDLSLHVNNIAAPVLCIAGSDDLSTPVETVSSLSDKIPHSSFSIIEEASHLPIIDKADAFVELLLDFTSEANGADNTDDSSLQKTGKRIREHVLGQMHVQQTERDESDFDKNFQDYITKSAWGYVWSRDELTWRERSMLTIALLAALGHEDELAMHIRATVNTGATQRDISEVLLHTAVYAGVPAANKAIKIAKEVLVSMKGKSSKG